MVVFQGGGGVRLSDAPHIDVGVPFISCLFVQVGDVVGLELSKSFHPLKLVLLTVVVFMYYITTMSHTSEVL